MFLVAGIVLAPFDFGVPERFAPHLMVVESGWFSDLLLNVVLFLPLGFIGQRTPGLGGSSPRRWLWLGLGVSVVLEATQLFLPSRYPTVSDVLANALGAWVGALLSARAAAVLGGEGDAVRRLLLDVPLIGIAYLLIPLLWLDGLALGTPSVGVWLQLPLAAAGGVALAGAARTAEAADRGIAGLVAVLAAVWWLVAAVPMLATAPFIVVVGLTLTITVAQIADPIWRWRRQRERRLEPVVVAVVLVLVLVHLVGGGRSVGEASTLSREWVIRWLARGAVLTTCGYLVAEALGRRELRLARALLLPGIGGGVLGAWLGGLSLVLPGALVAGFGAALYTFQRDHVVALRARAARRGVGTVISREK